MTPEARKFNEDAARARIPIRSNDEGGMLRLRVTSPDAELGPVDREDAPAILYAINRAMERGFDSASRRRLVFAVFAGYEVGVRAGGRVYA